MASTWREWVSPGKPGEVAVVPTAGGIGYRWVVMVGVGDDPDQETVRRAAGAGYRAAPRAEHLVTTLHQLPVPGALARHGGGVAPCRISIRGLSEQALGPTGAGRGVGRSRPLRLEGDGRAMPSGGRSSECRPGLGQPASPGPRPCRSRWLDGRHGDRSRDDRRDLGTRRNSPRKGWAGSWRWDGDRIALLAWCG